MDNTVDRKIKTYGRKKARGLSSRQSSALSIGLEAYKIDVANTKFNPIDAFGNSSLKKLVIEIGFGHGEHLVDQAKEHSDWAFVGCEPFENGVAKAVTKIQELNLNNVKIFMGDSRELLECMTERCVFEIDIMFPDPWPKARHVKRRLVSVDLLRMVSPLLVDNGIIKVATDCIEYIEYVIESVKQYNEQYGQLFSLSGSTPDALLDKPEDWGSTRYEQKAISKGKQCYYLTIHKED